MSILVMSQVWAHSKAEGSALLCALAIADFANDEGEAFPSVATLAHKCRISERSVQYAVAKLVELGELEVELNGGRGGANLYRVRVQSLRGANSAGVQNATEKGEAGCTRTIINRHNKKEPPKAPRVVFTDGGRLDCDAELVAEWRRAFPAVDVEAAILRAEAWLKANPANRKSNYERFLFNWLTREQDRAPATRAPQPAPAYTGRRPVHPSWYARYGGGASAAQEPSHVVDVVATQVPR